MDGDDSEANWDAKRQAWYQQFLAAQHARLQAQLQTLHGLQPWQQPVGSRFQNPLVGSDAPLSLNRQTDPQAGTFPFLMGGMSSSAYGDAGEGGVAGNPMLMQMLGFGGY